MRHIITILLLVCLLNYGYSQTTLYKNAKFGYHLNIPSWFIIHETDTTHSFGGTIPAIDNVENVIMITGFSKDKFSSFNDFQRIYITGNVFGKETLYSKDHVWYGRNERDFKQIENGVSSRVFTIFEKNIYDNQFVLLESSKAYLWIQFTSTPTTYDMNVSKFDDFLAGLTVK
jgi:hypothetical protein